MRDFAKKVSSSAPPWESESPAADDDAGSESISYGVMSKAADEHRYTLGVLYAPGAVDAHDEFTDDVELQKAVWDYAKSGDRKLMKQHGKEHVGDIVGIMQWPFPVDAELQVPGEIEKAKVTLPANTVYMGVIWSEDSWPLVKSGKMRGYSMGGKAVRVRDAEVSKELVRFRRRNQRGQNARGKNC